MATSNLGGVEPDVISLERHQQPGETVGLEEGFMTLKQAEYILGEDYIFYFKQQVWDNVVLVRVQTRSRQFDCGTGFLFLSVGGKSMIMTNYHVVRNRRPETQIQVCFDYDGPGSQLVWYDCNNPLYYSRNGQEGVDEDHQDFAVFCIRGKVNRQPTTLQHLAERANLSFQQSTKGIIVGHPQGGYKRLSIVELHPDSDDESNTERRYSSRSTRPGSSGSPVLSFRNPVSPVALHYGVRRKKHCDTCTCADGVGVNILSVIDFINRSPLTQCKLQEGAAKNVVPADY